MTWAKIDGRGLLLPALQAHIDALPFNTWRPSAAPTIHNTASPALHDWHSTPGPQRMKNLENYFKNERGWPSGPHAFVADDLVWLFTPFNVKGTHSPSWNGTRIGIEMVGNFTTGKGGEDADAGLGAKVIANAIALTGMLCGKLGHDPEGLKFHKEDTKTTHDCPGDDVREPEFKQRVLEWMGHAGDLHVAPSTTVLKPTPKFGTVVNVPKGDVLNVRDVSSVSGTLIASLNSGARVIVKNTASNNGKPWHYVSINPAGTAFGWVNGAFIKVD